mmetsp:Transcript_14452/g.35751  ORF Transcript_14452/g.35751 Transcript_14452/m.35751 type:complete len:665 (+) Transcript_14452:24-2018(+)
MDGGGSWARLKHSLPSRTRAEETRISDGDLQAVAASSPASEMASMLDFPRNSSAGTTVTSSAISADSPSAPSQSGQPVPQLVRGVSRLFKAMPAEKPLPASNSDISVLTDDSPTIVTLPVTAKTPSPSKDEPQREISAVRAMRTNQVATERLRPFTREGSGPTDEAPPPLARKTKSARGAQGRHNKLAPVADVLLRKGGAAGAMKRRWSTAPSRGPHLKQDESCGLQTGIGEGERRFIPLETEREHAFVDPDEKRFFELRPLKESERLAVSFWLAEAFDWESLTLALGSLVDCEEQGEESKAARIAYNQRLRCILEALAVTVVRDDSMVPVATERMVQELITFNKAVRCGQIPVIGELNKLGHRYELRQTTPHPLLRDRTSGLEFGAQFLEECHGVTSEMVEELQLQQHPNIVRVHEVLAGDKRAVVIHELMQGGSLVDVVKLYDGEHSEAHVRNVMGRVFQALAFLHQRGVIHGEVRSERVFCTKRRLSGEVKLCPSLRAFDSPDFDLPVHVAPEELKTPGRLLPCSDLWSCGVLLYQLLTGEYPFFDSDADKLQRLILSPKECPSWSLKAWKRVSHEGQDLCRLLLEKSVQKRGKLSARLLLDDPWFQLDGDSLSKKSLHVSPVPVPVHTRDESGKGFKQVFNMYKTTSLKEGILEVFGLEN